MEEKVIQINGGITINANVSVKKHYICEKGYVWNPSGCICGNGKCLASVMYDSVISCNGVIDLPYLFINCCCIIDCIFCYLIKYRGKYLLPFHNTDNKLNKFYIDIINWK